MSEMRAGQAREIAREAERKERERSSIINDKGEEDARLYAERRFRAVLRGILKRIERASRDVHSKNEIQMGVTVEIFLETGKLCDGELKNERLACKIIMALQGLGYKVESCTVRTGSRWSGDNPDYISYTKVNGWIIKW